MLRGHHDFETASALSLKDVGVSAYCEHPSTRCWCMHWRLGKGAVHAWHPGDADPLELLNHVYHGGIMVAHNAAFERTVWNVLLRERYVAHWPALRIAQQDCTMARAMILGLPAGLGHVALAMRLTLAKDEEGGKVMRQMARPRSSVPCSLCAIW